MPFSDLWLEKLCIYLKFFNHKISKEGGGILPLELLEDVDMDSYKIDTTDTGQKIDLEPEGELNPSDGPVPGFTPEEKTRLSEIIKALNEAFNTDFSDNDRVLLKLIKDNLLDNEELAEKIKNNSKENVAAIFDTYFSDVLNSLINSNFAFYRKIMDNEVLRDKLKLLLLDAIYEEQK